MEVQNKKLTVTVTLKSWGGGYHTRDYTFQNEEAYDDWVRKHHEDHRIGKIIGIHNMVYHD